MLPRNGFFKNIQCPYNKANLCHRPYCHYKHAASGYTEDKKTTVSSTYLYETKLSSNVEEQKQSPYSVSSDNSEGGGYVPTPVVKCKPTGILKTSNYSVPLVSVPEYRPTPISKLRELNISHGQYDNGSSTAGSVRKKKNMEEYDPTEIRCAPKKSVSFAVVEACEPSFSSDDDLDDSTSAAKFSDDDSDDNQYTPTPPPTNENQTLKSSKTPDLPEEKDTESDLDEKKVDEFSLVDKILTETKRNEKLLAFRKKEILNKPAPVSATKVPLILKGTKVSATSKVKSGVSNFDIYNTEDDSQSSIPDYSAFDTLLPPIEIDSLIKSKYDKKTFNSDIPSYNSPQQVDEETSIISEDDLQMNDKSHENSSKHLSDKSKFKKIDEKIKDSKVTNKKKSSKEINDKNKKKHSRSEDKDRSGKTDNAKKSDEKVKDYNKSSKKSDEKINDSSNRTSEKSKSSSNKSGDKDLSKRTSDNKHSSKKVNDKTRESDRKITEKNKHKSNSSSSNEKSSSKHKSSFKEKSKDSKHSSKYDVSSSTNVELQDGKVTSSCIEKNSKSGESIKHSKSGDSKVKHDTISARNSKKPFKRKKEVSDSESNSEKEHSRNKYSFKIPKLDNAVSSMDESVEEIDISSDKPYRSKKKSEKHSDEAVSTTDDDSDITFIKVIKSEKSDDRSLNSESQSMDEDIIISSDSDYDPNEECWKIFNETYNEASDDNVNTEKQASAEGTTSKIQDLNVLRKKRFAHAAASNLKKSKTSSERTTRQPINPGLVMHNRYAQMLKLREQSNEMKAHGAQAINSAGRIGARIAVSPNNSLLAAINEKKKLNQSAASDFTPLPSTVSKTLKPTKRVAHIPDLVAKPRPIIPADYGSKVPTNIRQKFLNAFIDEYLKFTSVEEDAYDDALEEEKKAYQRSSSKAIYMNVASNTLARLRHKTPELSEAKKSDGVSSTTTKTAAKSVSHETVLNGPMAQRTSFSIEKKKPPPVPDLKGTPLYEYLLTYSLSEDQLKENGFPMPHPTESGRAVIEGIYASKSRYCNDQFKRTCSRCQKVYYVNVDGDYVRDEECDFHWGRLWKRRIAGALESRYTCCQGDAESDGCCVSTGHVFDGSEAFAFKGYVKTLPKSPPPDKYYGIYALDCEMCYTTAGMELTRLTVVGPDCKPVYETFVRPINKVLDYNTRFSGISEDDLKNCRTTLRDVQAVLLCIFNSRTILIGHSLESDFKALKLIHTTVVDTSVVFPHKMGLPYKRALKTLMGEKLNKIIQNEVGGHDSQEDAVACMELLLWKIKEDLKANR